MKKIILLHHEGYFGQSLPTFKTMDIGLIKTSLEGYGFCVSTLTFQELVSHEVEEKTYYVCGSHQNPNVKAFLDDILDLKFDKRHNLIPSRQLIKAHENKGYQGELAKLIGLPYVNQHYYIESINIKERSVAKVLGGAGSGGVKLIENGRELISFLRLNHFKKIGIKRIGYLARAYFQVRLKKSIENENKWNYYRWREPYVIQDFIPNLLHDFKVLVFGEKVFVLKRGTRENDFRASGSGKFEFIKPTKDLLNFALNFKNALNTPYVSIDVVEHSGGFECIEYQCAHFGPYTQMNAPCYYVKDGDSWLEMQNDTTLEELIASSIVDNIRNV